VSTGPDRSIRYRSHWYLQQFKAKGHDGRTAGPALETGFPKVGEQLTAAGALAIARW